MGFQVTTTDGICHLVMDHPPVNALTVAGWFELADLLTAAGRDPEVGVVILSAAGKGFNAGVDIKEMQNTEGFDALIGANRGCAAAFGAIYDCEVPVICVVHDFVLGGGIGLMGNSDIIVAAEGTTIGLPEVKQEHSAPPHTWPGWSPRTECVRWSTPPSQSTCPCCTPGDRWPRWCHATR